LAATFAIIDGASTTSSAKQWPMSAQTVQTEVLRFQLAQSRGAAPQLIGMHGDALSDPLHAWNRNGEVNRASMIFAAIVAQGNRGHICSPRSTGWRKVLRPRRRHALCRPLLVGRRHCRQLLALDIPSSPRWHRVIGAKPSSSGSFTAASGHLGAKPSAPAVLRLPCTTSYHFFVFAACDRVRATSARWLLHYMQFISRPQHMSGYHQFLRQCLSSFLRVRPNIGKP